MEYDKEKVDEMVLALMYLVVHSEVGSMNRCCSEPPILKEAVVNAFHSAGS
jgi:hypothetical protein